MIVPVFFVKCSSANAEEKNDGICNGLKYRTVALVGGCMDFLGQFQYSVLSKLGWEPKVESQIGNNACCFRTEIRLDFLCLAA